MKRLIIIIMLFSVGNLCAQSNLADTLIIKLGDKAYLKVMSDDLPERYKKFKEIDAICKAFYSQLMLSEYWPKEKNLSFEYRPSYKANQIIIKEKVTEPVRIYSDTAKHVIVEDLPYKVIFNQQFIKAEKVEIFFSDKASLNEIINTDKYEMIVEAVENIATKDYKKRAAITTVYNYENAKLKTENSVMLQNRINDKIVIYPVIGIDYPMKGIGGTTSLNAEMVFPRKYNNDYKAIGFSYQLIYYTDFSIPDDISFKVSNPVFAYYRINKNNLGFSFGFGADLNNSEFFSFYSMMEFKRNSFGVRLSSSSIENQFSLYKNNLHIEAFSIGLNYYF